MDKYLVDSDVVIWFLKGREKEAQLLKNLSRGGELYCSVVTIAEVRAGLTKQPEKIISQLANIFVPIEINSEIAQAAGAFKQKYKLDITDMFIAATAVESNLILVSYNKKHFPMSEVKLYIF